MFKSKLKFDRQVMEEANSRRSSRVATPTGSNCFPDSILDIEEKVMFIMFTLMMIAKFTLAKQVRPSNDDIVHVGCVHERRGRQSS